MSEEQQCDKHWRKKPVVIEAVQWDESMTTLLALRAKGLRWVSHDGHVEHPDLCRNLRIRTLEDRDDGAHHVSPGDWIIKGVAGEFYACKPDIFAATYEPAFTRSHVAEKPAEETFHNSVDEREVISRASAPSTTPQKPVAFVPLHPRNGPLWANTVPSLDADRPAHYEVMPLYTAPPTGSGEPVAWRWRRADDQPWINSSKPPSFDTPEALACWTIQPLYVASATLCIDAERYRFCMKNGFPKACYNPEREVHYFYVRADVCPEESFGWDSPEKAIDETMALMNRADGGKQTT